MTIEKFLKRVSMPNDQGCRNWLLGVNANGYGRTSHKNSGEMAHRLIWKLMRGPIPAGMVVRHTCDNRLCCEITHLCPGSQMDNIQDRESRGRSACQKGENNGNAKLTNEQLQELLSSNFNERGAIKRLSTQYGINRSYLYRLRYGQARRSYTAGTTSQNL